MRIRSRLLILVFAILLPSMLGAVLSIYYVYHAQQQSYQESIQDIANAMARLLDKEIVERIKVLETLSRSPAITDDNLRDFYRFAQEIASTRKTVIVLSDLSGQQFMNTRSPYGAGNLPRMTPSLLAAREKAGPDATIVSDVYFAPIGKEFSFAVQVPVKRNGQVLFYLGMGAFASELQAFLEEQKLPPGWIATILDRQGVIAARTQEASKFVGITADATLHNKIIKQKQGTNDGVTLDGIPVTAFFSQAPRSEWSFVVSVPSSALARPARQATVVLAGIALLLLGVGAVAAAIIARRTVKPMEALRQTAVDLGLGKVVSKQTTGVLEIDAVSMEMARASEHIRSSKAELELRVSEAVGSAEKAQKALLQSQKLEALGRLTGGIAHDFNNVLQTLTTGLQLILLAVTEPRIKQTVQACQRAVDRAGELTRQLMAFGRVQDAHLQTIDIVQQLEVIRPLLTGALRSNIELRVELGEQLWPVTLDPAQLELALLNVTINARDAMPAGGSLTITVHNMSVATPNNELAAGDYVRIGVSDTGDGMSADVLNKALDPFFTTKPVGQGSGMGLPQAYGFAKQMGGTLTIDSNPGQGSTISFYLPRARRSAPDALPPIQRTSWKPAKSTGKLLFVEDDPLVSAVVVPALRSAGFDVHEARSGSEALGLLDDIGPFDVVFSDIVMPGQVAGIDLAEYVSKHFPDTKIVLATGYTERRTALPDVKILSKPYDVEEAVRIINAP